MSNGQVYYIDNEGVQNYIGTLPNLADTTTYLFGNNVPSDVEYITLDGITLMTYQGAVIACGYLETSSVKEGVYSINDIINSDLVGAAGAFVDEITGLPIYGGISSGVAVTEGILRIDGNTLDYDNVIGLLANFMNFADGSPYDDLVIEKYVEVMSNASERELLNVLITEMAIYGTVILEFAKEKNYNVTIEWEDSGSGGTRRIGMDDICKDYDAELKEIMPEVKPYLEEIGEEDATPYHDEVEKQYSISQKIKPDPLVFDMDGDGIEMTELDQGTHFDMDADGLAEKVNWTSEDAFLALDVEHFDGSLEVR